MLDYKDGSGLQFVARAYPVPVPNRALQRQIPKTQRKGGRVAIYFANRRSFNLRSLLKQCTNNCLEYKVQWPQLKEYVVLSKLRQAHRVCHLACEPDI